MAECFCIGLWRFDHKQLGDDWLLPVVCRRADLGPRPWSTFIGFLTHASFRGVGFDLVFVDSVLDRFFLPQASGSWTTLCCNWVIKNMLTGIPKSLVVVLSLTSLLPVIAIHSLPFHVGRHQRCRGHVAKFDVQDRSSCFSGNLPVGDV